MAGRGRRNPALLAAMKEDVQAGVVYVCGARPLKFGEYELTEGVEVPGAHTWPRLRAWVDARRVRQVLPGETYTPFAEWKAPIDLERAQFALAAAREKADRLEGEAAELEAKALAADPAAEDSEELVTRAATTRALADAALREVEALATQLEEGALAGAE